MKMNPPLLLTHYLIAIILYPASPLIHVGHAQPSLLRSRVGSG